MAQILVRNLDDSVVEALKLKEKREGKSLEQIARDGLISLARDRKLAAMAEIRAIQSTMRPVTIDPVDLIREYRDNDEPCR